MQLVDGDLVVSPTDLTRFAACRHLSRLDLEVARGVRPAPPKPGEALELLFRRGLAHEADYVARLEASGRSVVRIPVDDHPKDVEGLRELERLTVAAMQSGADVVYQATFFDGVWRGHADFLLRRDDRPGRWSWSYDVADTKLARRLKVAAVLQMSAYAERLTVLQGVPPGDLVVLTGDGLERAYPFDACAAYARRLRAELLAFVADDPAAQEARTATVPLPVEHCGQCRWQDHCRSQWRAGDDLSLVAGMRRGHALWLREIGITTLAELGSATAETVAAALSRPVAVRLTQQARLQLQERETGRPAVELLAAEPDRGLALLPAPSPGDVFFDIEGDPFVGDHGLEYLFGVWERGTFTAHWATDPAQERVAFEALVDHLMAAWEADPAMHVYHYAPYEPSRLKALSGRYDTRVAEVDRLLRGQRLVDLYAVVKQGVRVGKESYSLKKLEEYYWGHARVGAGVSDALGSVVAFEKWLIEGGDAVLEDIRRYNEEDCRSTEALRDWLEGLRLGAGGDLAFTRPEHGAGKPSTAVADVAAETEQLTAALLATLPDGPADAAGRRSVDHQAVWLLAMLLDWHRREALPEWWEHFHRLTLTDDELVADSSALAGLHGAQVVESSPRSTLWRMSFEPQDTKLGPGAKQWKDPRTGYTPTEIVEIRPDEGWLTFRKPPTSRDAVPECTLLVPPAPIPSTAQARRLRDLAAWVLENGIDHPSPQWRAARDLLRRETPRVGSTAPTVQRPGEVAAAAVSRLARALDAGVLPVQGPPGTGKTYAGARAVLDLIAEGKRVGVCAFSHKAIGNLLDEICAVAEERGQVLRGLQKADPQEACASQAIPSTTSNEDVERAVAAGDVDLVAGTSWLFARAGMVGAVDVLVVDEAGQLSLANVVAISAAAQSLVLLGDPQQLAQPVKGIHPHGAHLSALEHLLAGHPTIAPHRGILLDTTFRMHEDVAGFVSWLSYEGRLHTAEGLSGQRVGSASPLGGTGLRWVPVAHRGNTSASSQEAEVVAGLVEQLLADGTWTDRGGATRPLRPDDVLVLAPYNQQVHRLRHAVQSVAGGEHVRVGTVDKYQGQEAPVVLYSLASSSARDAPRGTDFLYSLNRLTVALSRARAVVAVVASPALLLADVRRPEQLGRVNALCALAEYALPVSVPPDDVPPDDVPPDDVPTDEVPPDDVPTDDVPTDEVPTLTDTAPAPAIARAGRPGGAAVLPGYAGNSSPVSRLQSTVRP